MSGPVFLARTIHGRAIAMARLETLLAEGGALALTGDAGIGKTRMAQWTVAQAQARRMAVLEGAALLGLAEPLGVFRDLVRAARRAAIEPPPRDPLAAGFPAQVLPELGGAGIDAGNLGATFEAAGAYLGAVAGGRGALVVLEDLHWADATSLSLIAFLARTLRGPVRLLLTFRPEARADSPALDGLRAELRRSRAADELLLTPLSTDDATAMLTEILGGPPAPDVTAELVRLAGGNPFALEELTRAVVDSGWLDPVTRRRRGTGGFEVPWTLAESIRGRAAMLAPGEREVAAWAALIGARFDARLLQRASGLDQAAVLDGLEALVRAGLVVEVAEDQTGNAFAFRHAIVHESLAQEGLATRRRSRHAAVLTAAEGLDAEGVLAASPAELARYAMAAGDRERTLAHSRRAVGEAQELGAVEEAVVHLERALSLWTDDDGPHLRAELLFACGRLRARLARGDERAVELLEMAGGAYDALGDQVDALWCLAVLADARFEVGDRKRAIAEWEKAIPRLREAGQREALRTALVGYARGLALEERVAPARTAADEGLALVQAVESSSDAYERVNLLVTRGMVALHEFEPAVARPLLDEAVRLALAHHDDVGAARAHHITAASGIPFEPIPILLGHARTARELVARRGLRSLEAWYCVVEGFLLVESGDADGVMRCSAEMDELIGESGRSEWSRWLNEFNLAWGRLASGDIEGAGGRALEIAGMPLARSSRTFHCSALALAAEACLAAGDLGAAAIHARPALEDLDRAVAHGEALNEDNGLPIVAVLVAGGDSGHALELATALVRQYPSPLADAAVGLAATPSGPEEAAAALDAAAEGLDRMGRRLAAARVQAIGAQLAAQQPGGRAAAARLARGAIERFRAMGSDAWCRRLEGMLRSWGERAPTRAGPGEGGLSRRELEVLALVAEGLTNKAIARRLVISEHTAIRHVANLMAKLGAPSRAAAVKLAGERGLLTGATAEMAIPEGRE